MRHWNFNAYNEWSFVGGGGGGGGEFSTKVQKYKEVLQVLRSHMSTAEPLLLNVFHMRNAGWKKTLFFSIISET